MGSRKQSEDANKKAAETQAELMETLRLAGTRRRPQSDGRFLISWRPGSRALSYGVVANGQPMLITSKRRIVKVDEGGITRPKFDPDIARQFIENPAFGPEMPKTMEWCRQILKSHVWLPDDRLYWLLTIWGFGTYCYQIFTHYGYLFLHSKFKRSGKTRVEEILSHICFQASDVLNGPTAPAIRETAAEGGTVILDTIERWRGRSPEAYSSMMEFLDAGFRNGGKVIKMVPRSDSGWERSLIPVFAPYVLAAIDRDSLADTALDRAFVIEMQRKPITVHTKRYSYFVLDKEAEGLRQRFYVLALRNAEQISKIYESRALDRDLEALNLTDRASDIWRPLFAIVRAFGLGQVEKELASLTVDMGRDPEAVDDELNLKIISTLRKRNQNGKVVGMTSDLVAHLRVNKIEMTEIELQRLLTHWGFAQANIRLSEGPRRAWELSDECLNRLEFQLKFKEVLIEL